jgi:CRISPR-associated protein Cmr6
MTARPPQRQSPPGRRDRRDRNQNRSSGSHQYPPPSGKRPLYAAAASATLVSATTGNAGLWYDKFCDRWEPDWTGFAGDSGKRDWIAQIANIDAGNSQTKVGYSALMTEAVKRLEDLVEAQAGRSFRRTTAWRFVTGLGRNHPVENGFAWRHDLGTPYIAGSSLKGLARAYARDWASLDDETLERTFGPRPEAGLAIGSVVFLDALPIEPVALDADVMTPHYGPWYRGENNAVPADWHSPTPIPFLTVAPGQTFVFAMLPRNRSNQRDQEDCKMVADLLNEALETLGAGAKTAVGYGQFVEEEAKEDEVGSRTPKKTASTPRAPDPENWSGLEAIVYSEVVRIIEDRGAQLLVRFPDGSEEQVERHEARLRNGGRRR